MKGRKETGEGVRGGKMGCEEVNMSPLGALMDLVWTVWNGEAWLGWIRGDCRGFVDEA